MRVRTSRHHQHAAMVCSQGLRRTGSRRCIMSKLKRIDLGEVRIVTQSTLLAAGRCRCTQSRTGRSLDVQANLVSGSTILCRPRPPRCSQLLSTSMEVRQAVLLLGAFKFIVYGSLHKAFGSLCPMTASVSLGSLLCCQAASASGTWRAMMVCAARWRP